MVYSADHVVAAKNGDPTACQVPHGQPLYMDVAKGWVNHPIASSYLHNICTLTMLIMVLREFANPTLTPASALDDGGWLRSWTRRGMV